MVVLNANDSEKTLDTSPFSQALKKFTKGNGCHYKPGMAIGFDLKNFAMDSADYGVGMTKNNRMNCNMLLPLRVRSG